MILLFITKCSNIRSHQKKIRCRYGNSEVHSISAFLGGCAAHESIKLLTNQFIPFNNTMVYNGIKQSTTVYEL